jgi:5-methylcytosine-specific restriction endonuclease McrA
MLVRYRRRTHRTGQRALVTSKLRNFIKSRDNDTCRSCSVSLAAEPHLLLEVDHVIPVSKGGMSTPENLQTLCWRCNRTKSNKLATA